MKCNQRLVVKKLWRLNENVDKRTNLRLYSLRSSLKNLEWMHQSRQRVAFSAIAKMWNNKNETQRENLRLLFTSFSRPLAIQMKNSSLYGLSYARRGKLVQCTPFRFLTNAKRRPTKEIQFVLLYFALSSCCLSYRLNGNSSKTSARR